MVSNKSPLPNKQEQYAKFFHQKQATLSEKMHFFPKNDTKQAQKLILVSQILVYIKYLEIFPHKTWYQNKKFTPFGNIRAFKHSKILQILINLYIKFDTIFAFLSILVTLFRIFRTFEQQHPPFAPFALSGGKKLTIVARFACI